MCPSVKIGRKMTLDRGDESNFRHFAVEVEIFTAEAVELSRVLKCKNSGWCSFFSCDKVVI